MQLEFIFKVSGDPDQTRCYNCGNVLNRSCTAETPAGRKWFCQQLPTAGPEESCYHFWLMRNKRESHGNVVA